MRRRRYRDRLKGRRGRETSMIEACCINGLFVTFVLILNLKYIFLNHTYCSSILGQALWSVSGESISLKLLVVAFTLQVLRPATDTSP